jgi:hypothetical protein
MPIRQGSKWWSAFRTSLTKETGRHGGRLDLSANNYISVPSKISNHTHFANVKETTIRKPEARILFTNSNNPDFRTRERVTTDLAKTLRKRNAIRDVLLTFGHAAIEGRQC